jgi:Mg2+-importing ATPase
MFKFPTMPFGIFAAAMPAALRADAPRREKAPHPLLEFVRIDGAAVLARLGVDGEGLTSAEVVERLARFGPNAVAQERRRGFLAEIAHRFLFNPINILLTILAVVSYLGDDAMGAAIMLAMVVMAVFLSYFQEARSGRAVEQLRSLVSNTATVRRVSAADNAADGSANPLAARKDEVPIERLVPGDVVHLSAGDMIPADLRLLAAKDLFINQAALTGESMPVEKFAPVDLEAMTPLDARNLCFMGSNVVSGSATGVIVATGERTCFGELAG